MTSRLRVYLAGPIRGCTDNQQTWWREEVKQRLGRRFDFEDPMEWADDQGIPLEIPKLEACDVMLANMWKESIGTTVGVVRANQQGKTIVLVDPNRMDNSILEALVLPEKPVRTLDEACARLLELETELEPFTVHKKGGRTQRFNPAKVTRGVALAAAEAGVTDAGFEERISSPAIANLRRKADQRAPGAEPGYVTWEEIRAELFDQLEKISASPKMPADLRARAECVLEAWRRKEQLKKGEQALKESEERVRLAHEEAEGWKRLFMDVKEKGIPDADPPAEPHSPVGPRFKSVSQVLEQFTKKWRAFVVIHDEAKPTVRDIKPRLSGGGLDDLYALLEELGEFARDRAIADADNAPKPQFEERFGNRYAPTESAATRMLRKGEFRQYGTGHYYCLQHLKMKGDAGQRVRLYFDELPSGQFLIGWIGHRVVVSHKG